MEILEFIASLNWPDGEMERRISALDAQFGTEAAYGATMILTDEEYGQYCACTTPNNRTVQALEIVFA